MAKIFSSGAEESALGITEAQTKEWTKDHAIPDSDTIDLWISPEKRPRAVTGSTDSGLSVSDKHQTPKKARDARVVSPWVLYRYGPEQIGGIEPRLQRQITSEHPKETDLSVAF
ncbi:hypothetical protein B0H14DRAFT_2575318 [Mycena olivaceomarginata]|nr:hypothetical protein B0H14DRAFT_2575318 [Mycena olivaceomarginata]